MKNENNLAKALKQQTKELKSYADEQTEKLARVVASAFEKQNEYLDNRFDEIESTLDVRSTVLNLEKRLQKIEHKLSHA